MARISWGEPGTRSYEAGVDRGVLYPSKGYGVPWNGLISVDEAPSDSNLFASHVDGRKIWNQRRGEGFSATITAFSYPKEFEKYIGYDDGLTGQNRSYFGFSYRTRLGDDLDPEAGSLIHLVYNALASPAPSQYDSASDSVGPTTFSWGIETTPVILANGAIGSHVIINTKMAHSWAVTALESQIYGSGLNEPYLPTMSAVMDIFESASILRVTDHGDGTWTAEGPDSAIEMLDATTFQITWPSAVYINDVTYRLSSL